MRHILAIGLCVLSAFSCARKHEAQATVQTLADVQAERDSRLAAFDFASIPRCDKLTFAGLADTSGKAYDDLFRHEYQPGEWHRDVAPCYPGDSQTEISRDALLGAIHAFIGRDYRDPIRRMWTYGQAHKWQMGEPKGEITSGLPLAGLIAKAAGVKSKGHSEIETTPNLPDPFTGFRGHVLAMYLWASLRVYGAVSDTELAAARKLRDDNPDSPLFHALYHRMLDGDQTAALERMSLIGQEIAPFGWGSCPAAVYYAVTTAILEGR